MKHWWFRYAIWQLIEKLIILRLLLILILQLINQLLYTAPSIPTPCAARWHRRVPKVPWRCHELEDYLFIWHGSGVL